MRIISIRRTVQIISFLLVSMGVFGLSTGFIYPVFFCNASPGACAACPIWMLEHGSTACGEGNWEDGFLMFVWLAGFLGFLLLLFGRWFCGWACPIGFLQELIDKGGEKAEKVKYSGAVSGIREKIESQGERLKYLKYIILILIQIGSYITGRLFFTELDPIGAITATFWRLSYEGDEWNLRSNFWIKMFFVILFFILVFIIGRGWCRFVCPIGAMFAPFNKVDMMRLKLDEEKCIDCGKCAKVCPMKIEMPYSDNDFECIRCGECIDSCPKDALSLNFMGKRLF